MTPVSDILNRAPVNDCEQEKAPVKCVIIGDGCVGISCLLSVYTQKVFPTSWTPTVFDTHPTTLKIDNEDIDAIIWELANQEGYQSLRRVAYLNTDVFILVFTVDNQDSSENVEEMWKNELEGVFPKGQVPPIVLVGTKTDLRGGKTRHDRPLTTYKDGVELAKRIGARRYVECSAKTDPQSCHNVFETAVREALVKKKSVKSPALSLSCFKTESPQLDDER